MHAGKNKIRWLGEEALRRYLKLKPPSFVPNREEVVHDIRKTVGGAILDPEDMITTVLDDNDFVSIGKQGTGLSFIHSSQFIPIGKFIPAIFLLNSNYANLEANFPEVSSRNGRKRRFLLPTLGGSICAINSRF